MKPVILSVCKKCNEEFLGVKQKRYCSLSCKARVDYEKNSDVRIENALTYSRAKTIEEFVYLGARARCKRSGLDFTIELSDIPKMPEYCPITGLEMFRNEGTHQPNSPTLDRVDNTKGYIPGNVRIISFQANRWKSDMSPDHIRRLYEYVNT